MTLPRFRLRMWHLLGLVAVAAAYLAVMQFRQDVFDPVSILIRRLRAFDPVARVAAARELESLGREAESAIPALLGALHDDDLRLRAQAALAAGMILNACDPRHAGHPRAGDVRSALTAALSDPDPGTRRAAAVALAILSTNATALHPALIEATGDADPQVRSLAVSLLAPFSDDQAAWAAALAAIRDPDAKVRDQAICFLAFKPTLARLAEVREALAPASKDANEFVRGSVASTLGRYAQKIAADIPELYDLLADPSPYVRKIACVFMPHHAGWRAGIAALVRALDDPDPVVRLAAAERLGRIGLDAEEALPDLRRAAEDRESSIRGAASGAIRSIEVKAKEFRTKVLPGSIEDLASPDADIRRGAAEILGSFGPKSAPAVPVLIRSLGDGDAAVRLASALALGRIGPVARDALPALSKLADDPDGRIRRSAESAATSIRGGAPGP